MIWLSAFELAGLPGLPNSKRLVNLLCKSDWECRDRIGRGGGKEYKLPERYLTDEFVSTARSKFPEKFPVVTFTNQDTKTTATKLADGVPMVQITANSEVKTAELADMELLKVETRLSAIEPSDAENLVVAARNEILLLLRRYLPHCQSDGKTKVFCYELFTEQVRSGKVMTSDGNVTIPDWVLDAIRSENGRIKLSRATLNNWEKDLSLKPKHKGRIGKDFFSLCPDAATFCESMLKEYGDRATARFIKTCFKDLKKIGTLGLEIAIEPTVSQIYYWLNVFKANNTALYNRYCRGDRKLTQPAFGSYSVGVLPNGVWEMDSTLIDVEIATDDEVKLKRWAVVQCVDVATRRRKFLLYPTSKTEAICLLVRDCIIDWGIPRVIKTDNGADYSSMQLDSFLRGLAIDHVLCTPYEPREKPHVERGYRLLQHRAEFEKLPGMVGHNVAQRTAKRKRSEGEAWSVRMTAKQFGSWLQVLTETINNSDNEGLGMSPIQKLMQFVKEGWTKTVIADVKQLDWLLHIEKERTVNAQGIKVNGRTYLAPELGGLVGSKVCVRHDPSNPNEISVYSGADLATATFICRAVWDLQLSAEERADLAIKAKRASKAVDDHVKAVGKVGRRFKNKVEQNPEVLLSSGSVTALVPTGAVLDLGAAVRDAIGDPILPPVQTQAQINDLETRRQEQLAEVAKVEAAKARRVKTAQDEKDMLWRIVRAWESKSNCDPQELAYVARWYDADEGAVEGLLFALDDLTEKRFLIWLKGQKAISKKEMNQ